MTLSQSNDGYIVSLVSESIEYNLLNREEKLELQISTYLNAFFELRDKCLDLCKELERLSIEQLL